MCGFQESFTSKKGRIYWFVIKMDINLMRAASSSTKWMAADFDKGKVKPSVVVQGVSLLTVF